MANLIMLLGLILPNMQARQTASVDKSVDSKPNSTRVPQKASIGMTKDEVIRAYGEPIALNRYSNLDGQYLVMMYDGEVCAYTMSNCSVRVDEDLVTALYDVKPTYQR